MSANDARKIPSGCEDGNALELAQIEEIAIARDQAICSAGAGRIQKFIVVRIPTDMNKASRGNDVTISHKDDHGSLARFGGNVAIEFFTRYYAEQFVARGRREDQCSLAGEQIQ